MTAERDPIVTITGEGAKGNAAASEYFSARNKVMRGSEGKNGISGVFWGFFGGCAVTYFSLSIYFEDRERVVSSIIFGIAVGLLLPRFWRFIKGQWNKFFCWLK